MLARPRRLHLTRDFRAMWRAGHTVRGRFVVARTLPNTTNQPRFGCVVSTAVSKRAVDRNRIKRQLRALAARHLPGTSQDIVLYATKNTNRASFTELDRDFRDILAASYAPSTRRRH